MGEVISIEAGKNKIEKRKKEEVKKEFGEISEKAVENIIQIGLEKIQLLRKKYKEVHIFNVLGEEAKMSEEDAMEYLKKINPEEIQPKNAMKIFSAINTVIYNAK